MNKKLLLTLCILLVLVSGCDFNTFICKRSSDLCPIPYDYQSKSPRQFGVLEKTELTGYTDNEYMTNEEIEEIRKEILEKYPDCDNITINISERKDDFTEIRFYGDCYVVKPKWMVYNE